MRCTGKLRLNSCLDKPKEKKDCHFYARGQCEKGASCPFSHAATPRTKSELCKYYVNNCCLKGDDCPFSHALSTFPCKFFHMRGSCLDADACRFSHEPLSEEAKQKLLKRVAEEQHGPVELHNIRASSKATEGGGLGHVSLVNGMPPSDLELFPLGGKHTHKTPLKGKATPSQNRPSPHERSEKIITPLNALSNGTESGGPLLSSSRNFTMAQEERKAKVDGFLQSQLDNSCLMRKSKLGAASESSGGCFTSLRQQPKALSMGPASLIKPSNLFLSGESSGSIVDQWKSTVNDHASLSKPAALLGPSLLDLVSMSQKAIAQRGSPASSPGSRSMASKVASKQSTANMLMDRLLK